VAKLDGRLISMLDFEKITADVSPGSTVEACSELISKPETADNSHRILVAEDSMVLRRMILEALHKAGYENVIARENGQDAWDYLSQIREEDGPVKAQVSCVITDIEMPKMDGHHLTKRIKESTVLSQIPVIIFSSLISEDMKRKGEEIGADDQLSKPQIHLLVESLRRLIQ
jgi:two-component system chemotaxis response regulator CheV